MQIKLPPEDSDCTSDLAQWFHCTNNKALPDTILSQAWEVTKCISFVFHHRSSGGQVEPVKETKTTKGKRKIIDEDDEEDYVESDNSDDKDYDGWD